VAIMFIAAITVCEKLGLTPLVNLGKELIEFAGRVVFGVIIFLVGIYLANLASGTIQSGKGKQANLLAFATRLIILVFTGFIALQHIVPKSEIVIWGFILIAGAIAVAIAIAFGIGGRDLAARKLEEWTKSITDAKTGK
jgi:hypothetical protein